MAEPAFYGRTDYVAGAGAVSPDFSTITAAGRQLWTFYRSANQPISAPSGWTELPGSPWATGTAGAADATALQIFKANALASGSETTLALADSGSSNLAFGIATDPADIDVISDPSVFTYTTAPSFPDLTTLGADRLILQALTNDSDTDSGSGGSAPTNAGLSSLTERADIRTAQGNGGGIWLVSGVKAVAGAIGTTTGTYGSSASGANMIAVTIALKTPAAGGDTITGGKAGASAAARNLAIQAGTSFALGKAVAAAQAGAASVIQTLSLVLGKAAAVAQARSPSISDGTPPTVRSSLGGILFGLRLSRM